MALLKPNGKNRLNYVIRFKGESQITLPTKNKREAQRVHDEMNAERKRKKYNFDASVVTMGALCEWDLRRANKRNQKAKNIKRGVNAMWKKILAYFEPNGVAFNVQDLTRKKIDQYEDYRQNSPRKPQAASIKREIACIKRSLVEVSRIEQFALPFPLEHWPSFKDTGHTVKLSQKGKRIPLNILYAWLSKLNGECRRLATFLTYTGMRYEECLDLEVSMLQHPDPQYPLAVLSIPAEITKIKTARRIAIHEEAYKALRYQIGHRIDGKIWSGSNYKAQMRNRGIELGLPFGIHHRDLRHTFCNIAMQKLKRLNINKYELSRYVGHKKAEQMNTYISPNDAEIALVARTISVSGDVPPENALISAITPKQEISGGSDLRGDESFLPALGRVAESGLKWLVLGVITGAKSRS